MADCMMFPETFDEFAKIFGFIDTKEYYTNGAELIPVFRVKQWLENESARKNAELERVKNITFGCDLSITSIKAEAIKEFAERLKEEEFASGVFGASYCREKIDILVKEMVGD